MDDTVLLPRVCMCRAGIGVRNRAARKAGLLQELEALEAQLGRDAASERHGGTEVTEYPLIEHYASYSRSRERQFPRPFLDQLADEVQHKLYPFSIPYDGMPLLAPLWH